MVIIRRVWPQSGRVLPLGSVVSNLFWKEWRVIIGVAGKWSVYVLVVVHEHLLRLVPKVRYIVMGLGSRERP